MARNKPLHNGRGHKVNSGRGCKNPKKTRQGRNTNR